MQQPWMVNWLLLTVTQARLAAQAPTTDATSREANRFASAAVAFSGCLDAARSTACEIATAWPPIASWANRFAS